MAASRPSPWRRSTPGASTASRAPVSATRAPWRSIASSASRGFSLETATQKVRAAEDGWNSRDPVRVSLAYTTDSQWRNRSEFLKGREEILKVHAKKVALAPGIDFNTVELKLA